MKTILTAQQNKVPWSKYGGKYSIFEKVVHNNIKSPQFNYQRGLKAFDDFITSDSASENIYLFILRNGFYLQLKSDSQAAYFLFSKHELKKISMEAFKVKLDNKEKLAGYLTLAIEQDKIRCFVPAKNFSALNKFLKQKYFKNIYQITIDPSPPVEQIKLLNILSDFGKPQQ